MSEDFIIITSSKIAISFFLDRLLPPIRFSHLGNGRYYIDNGQLWHGWLSQWEPPEGYMQDEDCFTKSQQNTIFHKFQDPKYFIISAPSDNNLYKIIEIIANTNELLIDTQMRLELVPGDEFIMQLKKKNIL